MSFLRKYSCYIYVALWMIYYLQHLLMISGVISQGILASLLVFSIYAFCQVNMHYKTGPYLKWLNIMLLIMSIYGLVPIVGGWTLVGEHPQDSTVSYLYLQRVYSSLLPIYTFYYFALTKRISHSQLFYVYITFVICSILLYYQRYIFYVDMGLEAFTNNMGFFFVPLIPMIHLLKIKDVWKYAFLVLNFVFILMSVKRGAIIVGALLAILFIIQNLKATSRKKSAYLLCASLVVVLILYYIMVHIYANDEYFHRRVVATLSGDMSGREYLFSASTKYFLDKTTPLEFIIGNGANASFVLFGNLLHNDWLEFAITQGILGVIMYIVYWANFVREWKNYQGRKECQFVLGSIIIAYFFQTLHSMSIDVMPPAATFCIGYSLAENVRSQYRLVKT